MRLLNTWNIDAVSVRYSKVMRVMIVQLRQTGMTIRQICIVLAMVFLIFFLAAPTSAIAAESNPGTGATSSVAASGSSDNSISTPAVSTAKAPRVVRLRPCNPTCTKYEKYTDYIGTNTKTKLVYSFWMLGVKYRLYLEYTQPVTAGHYQRTCTPMTRCSVNGLCEQGGETYTQDRGSWTKVGKWEITNYYVI